MTPRALIIDDDTGIRRVVRSVLDSLGHGYCEAGSQESARKIIGAEPLSYILLDMEIPEKELRGLPRIQNGLNLLEEIVQSPGTAHIPVIVMTAHGARDPQLAVEVLTNGAANWINKPFPSTGRTLDKVIKQTLAKRPARATPRTASGPEPKPFTGGEMTFFPDRVELCNVKIAGLQSHTHIRKILDCLRKKNSMGRYVAFSGEELATQIGAGDANTVFSAIAEFRKKARSLLGKEAGFICGDDDVIENSGGYRLKASITICEGAGVDTAVNIEPPNHTQHTAESRQQWIVEQLQNGVQLRLIDITKAFSYSKRTALRDIGQLRERGIVVYHGDPRDGYYSLASKSK